MTKCTFSLYVFLIIVTLNSCSSNSESHEGVLDVKEVEAAQADEKYDWVYETDIDKMDGTESKYASLISTNTLDFQFPYEGGSEFTLILRRNGDKTEDVLLSVDKGQFTPSLMGEEKVRVKFDNNDPVYHSFSMASDGSSDVIFINNEKAFISKLKATHDLMIEAEFYNEGRRIIEFDVSGLNWD